MKSRYLISRVLTLLGLVMLVTQLASTLAQTKNTNAFAKGSAAALNDKQIARLLGLKVPIAIPTYIPNGFRLEEVHVEKTQYSNDYSIKYKNNRGATFLIQSTDEGIGSVGTDNTISGKNPYFNNELSIGYQEEDKNSIWGEWIENRRQASGSKKTQYYSLIATKISLQEAMKIMKSLRYLEL